MIDVQGLRTENNSTILLGSHPGIIQSMLDYDFLLGHERPSITAIVALGRKQERYFWGEDEVMIPVVSSLGHLSEGVLGRCDTVLNVQSARRVLSSTREALEVLPSLKTVVVFAEQTPEVHALELRELAKKHEALILGPSSVGILLPGYRKIGAIGGTQYEQLVEAQIQIPGDIAVVSTSGGMVNELIHLVTGAGQGVSLAMALGGDRFPVTDPVEAMQILEADIQTKRVVYFGELGGTDEYTIAKMVEDGKLQKEIIAYIAGEVADLFETPPQFGHAGAIAESEDESANAKKRRLKEVGVTVCDSLEDMRLALNGGSEPNQIDRPTSVVLSRKKRSLVSHISGEKQGEMQLLGNDLMTTVSNNSLSSLVLSMLLGKQVTSKKAIEFTDYIMRTLVDHGPYVSGAVNTIVTARAGRDLVSGLTAGLLTIGPRFGGALNGAAAGWVRGVNTGLTAKQYVDSFATQGGIIPGIGHKLYRVDMPDPRVQAIKQFAGSNNNQYLNFALEVEKITTSKKGNLILNVDGACAAILLDILQEELKYTPLELGELADIEFFNALFVLSRSIGFTAHYLDQRRHDEGLFRFDPNDIRYLG